MRLCTRIALLCMGMAVPFAVAAHSLAQPDATSFPESGGQILVLLRLPPPHVRPGSDYAGSYDDMGGRSARRRVAAAVALRYGLTLIDDWPMPLLGLDCFVMAVPADRSPADVSATLSGAAGVAWAQPVNLFTAQSHPRRAEDPLFRAQPAAVSWHLADLHRIADGKGIRIAVVDSQIDADHPDLKGQVQTAVNFVAGRPGTPEQHGTAVAGIIAAHSGNGLGIAGIAPRARLMGLRACWQGRATTLCDSFSLAKAIYFAADNGAQVINLSLGGPDDPLLARLLDIAIRRGATVVAAVDRDQPRGGFPASHPGVVAVGDVLPAANDRNFVAPGRGIPTTQTGGRWSLVDGSSYAAAHVSGLFALMRSIRPAAGASPQLVAVPVGGSVVDSCGSMRRSGWRGACPTPSLAGK